MTNRNRPAGVPKMTRGEIKVTTVNSGRGGRSERLLLLTLLNCDQVIVMLR